MDQSNAHSPAKWAHRPLALLVSAACLCLAAGCGALPSLQQRTASTAILDTGSTRLGRAIAPRVEAHPGKSGIYPLANARDAFAARVLLARAAERSLDVQYYIWRNDMTGTMLFASLRDAADRGVRVRLLLDDNNTPGLDPTIAALDAHPNIEVRLFNPFVVRWPRLIGYITDFSRANRRMHNKSFTADSQATIIGGRNVGDEYFGAADDMLFADLDVMAIGPVARDVSMDFDRYWNSPSSYPVALLLPAVDPGVIQALSAAAAKIEQSAAAVAYTRAVRSSTFVEELSQGTLAMEWAHTQLVSDDPLKGLGLAGPEGLVRDKLKRIIGEPAAKLDLVSPYFVPTRAGVDAFVELAHRGVKVQVLTNSLEATDVAAVHSGYAKRRKPLLRAGITLYELRRMASSGTAKVRAGGRGSSASSLHSKTFSVDGARVFIGSFNFDPRSAELNTEMGFIIDSPALAQHIDAAFGCRIPADAYQVQLTGAGQLVWIERRGQQVVWHDVEPGTTFLQRAGVRLLSLLPIDWLL